MTERTWHAQAQPEVGVKWGGGGGRGWGRRDEGRGHGRVSPLGSQMRRPKSKAVSVDPNNRIQTTTNSIMALKTGLK